MSRGVLVLMLVAGLVAGCSGEHDRLDREGDPCRTVAEVCVDDEVVLVCADEVWTAQSCDEVCAGEAPGVTSDGCEAVSVAEGDCVCVPPSGGCTPGEAVCLDDQQLDYCEDSWTWATFSCASLCAGQPIHTISAGCEAGEGTDSAYCACTAIGAACSGESSVCIDSATLASCESGTWTQIDCAELCERETATCQPAVGGDGCACGS